MKGIALAGRSSGLITQREFTDRAEALAAGAAPGAENARRAAVDLMKEVLLAYGYGEGLAHLAPLIDPPAPDGGPPVPEI